MPEVDEKSNAESALARCLAAIQAIDPKAVEVCNVEGTVIIRVAREYAALLPADVPRLNEIFKNPPEQAMRELVDRGLAAYGAEIRLETLFETGDEQKRALYVEGGELKKKAVLNLQVVAGDVADVLQVIEAVRPGTGYADRARDLSRLHPQLVRFQDVLLRKELMTEAEIDRVGELGTLLPASGPKPKEIEAARLLRNKAWTHFVTAWREINRHLDFLYYFDPMGRSRYPSLYAKTPAPERKPKPAPELEPNLVP